MKFPPVTTCCICKKIKVYEEYIHDEETYKIFHNNMILSHGYCPNCLEEELKKVNVIEQKVNN
jgi:hypothetical protein